MTEPEISFLVDSCGLPIDFYNFILFVVNTDYTFLYFLFSFFIFYFFHFLFFVGTDGTIVGILFSAISDLVASGCFIFLSLSFVCGTLSGVPHISMGSSV